MEAGYSLNAPGSSRPGSLVVLEGHVPAGQCGLNPSIKRVWESPGLEGLVGEAARQKFGYGAGMLDFAQNDFNGSRNRYGEERPRHAPNERPENKGSHHRRRM